MSKDNKEKKGKKGGYKKFNFALLASLATLGAGATMGYLAGTRREQYVPNDSDDFNIKKEEKPGTFFHVEKKEKPGTNFCDPITGKLETFLDDLKREEEVPFFLGTTNDPDYLDLIAIPIREFREELMNPSYVKIKKNELYYRKIEKNLINRLIDKDPVLQPRCIDKDPVEHRLIENEQINSIIGSDKYELNGSLEDSLRRGKKDVSFGFKESLLRDLASCFTSAESTPLLCTVFGPKAKVRRETDKTGRKHYRYTATTGAMGVWVSERNARTRCLEQAHLNAEVQRAQDAQDALFAVNSYFTSNNLGAVSYDDMMKLANAQLERAALRTSDDQTRKDCVLDKLVSKYGVPNGMTQETDAKGVTRFRSFPLPKTPGVWVSSDAVYLKLLEKDRASANAESLRKLSTKSRHDKLKQYI